MYDEEFEENLSAEEQKMIENLYRKRFMAEIMADIQSSLIIREKKKDKEGDVNELPRHCNRVSQFF